MADNRLAAEHFDYWPSSITRPWPGVPWRWHRTGGAGLRDRLLQRAWLRRAGSAIARVAFMVADIAIELDAMRLMVWRACPAERGQPFQREAYLALSAVRREGDENRHRTLQLLGNTASLRASVERW